MKARVLVVDDNVRNIRLITQMLQDEGYDVYSINDSLCVFDKIKEVKPDIILLDIMMPQLDGLEICRILKNDPVFSDIPIIMVTARAEGKDVRKALELGAFDYIKKPIDEDEVISRMQSALKYKMSQDKLKEMAMKDGLTGIYNHSLLMELFEKELNKNNLLKKNSSFAMMDIDYFKKINDVYGHLAGDIVIKNIASLIAQSLSENHLVGRYGGEEFGIVFGEIDEEKVNLICEDIRKKIENYEFKVKDKKFFVTISTGICLNKADNELTISEIIERADKALYIAKSKGRNRVEIYQ